MKFNEVKLPYQDYLDMHILKDDEVFYLKELTEKLIEAGYDINQNQVQNHCSRNLGSSKMGVSGHVCLYGSKKAIKAYEEYIKKQLGENIKEKQ